VDVVAYGNENTLEYDLRVAPETDARGLRLRISGADAMTVDENGNLVILAAGQRLLMQKPAMYEELAKGKSGPRNSSDLTRGRRAVAGGYVIEPDGTVGFRIERQEGSGRFDLANFTKNSPSRAAAAGTLVIDPTLSVLYSTFLGGAGDDIATSVAVDSSGKVYVSGTTTSATSFSESSTKLGPGGGASDYFIAKIDPTKSGPNSLVYLTFIGGSGDEEGARLAVDANGNAAIVGTTTSTDFPVTDGSLRTAGANDATVTEVSATGYICSHGHQFRGPAHHHRGISNVIWRRNQRRFSGNFSAYYHAKPEILHVPRYRCASECRKRRCRFSRECISRGFYDQSRHEHEYRERFSTHVRRGSVRWIRDEVNAGRKCSGGFVVCDFSWRWRC
jgi:hypothetical protein